MINWWIFQKLIRKSWLDEEHENDKSIWQENKHVSQICFYRCDEFAKNSCWCVCFKTFVDDVVAQTDATIDY